MQEGCSWRRSDVAIPAIPVNSSLSPRSPSTATTTTVGELPPRRKRRTCPRNPSYAPPPLPCLNPPPPPPPASIATQSGAVPVCQGAYLHGCSVQLPMSTQVPNTSEASPPPSEGLHAFQFGIPPPCTSSFLPNCCIPPCQPSSLQADVAMLPPMPQINLNFLGSSNFVSFKQGSSSVLHPPIAQVPTNQLPAPQTFDHPPSHLPRQCSVQEGVT